MPLLFCPRCAVWWNTMSTNVQPHSGSLQRCTKCRTVLLDKPLANPTHQPRTELRPGVAAEWEE